MADIMLTVAGQALRAKIEQGNGDIPFEITRIVAGAGSSGDPLSLTAVVDERQEFAVTAKSSAGAETHISAMLTNAGDPEQGIPPLAVGYPLAQIGFYALDPDVGEILYNITQFANPAPVPAASERPWTYKPTFTITTSNTSEVAINLTPSGWLSREDLEPIIQQLSDHIGHGGTAQHPLADGVTPGFSEINYTQQLRQLTADGIRMTPLIHPDLNDVLEPGLYFTQHDVDAAGIENTPINRVFTLEVLRWGRAGVNEPRRIQRVTAVGNQANRFHRIFVRTIWEPANLRQLQWQEVTMIDDILWETFIASNIDMDIIRTL